MAFENLSPRQKTRAALHRDVISLCTETCHLLGLDIKRPAMDVIAELVYKKISMYGADLEAFARHAKRSTINTDDVKLLVRRNTSLKEHLGNLTNAPSASKNKRRKTANKPEKENAETATEPATKTTDNVNPCVDDVDMEGNQTIDLTFD